MKRQECGLTEVCVENTDWAKIVCTLVQSKTQMPVHLKNYNVCNALLKDSHLLLFFSFLFESSLQRYFLLVMLTRSIQILQAMRVFSSLISRTSASKLQSNDLTEIKHFCRLRRLKNNIDRFMPKN